MRLLEGWDNFYVIIGSAAAGLTGLTFVVIAFVRDLRRTPAAGLRAYVTPTVVHFAGVLALAAYMSVPHQTVASLSVGIGVGGVAGVMYGVSTGANLRAHGIDYVPVREDWIWNVVLPTLAYATLLATAPLIWYRPAAALYAVAAASVGLLFIGIRNAWDIAVWMTTQKPRD